MPVGAPKELKEFGNGCYAWIQSTGTWGFSNSGLIVDGDQTLLVDTLYDLPKTRDMLKGYRDAVPAAAQIGTLVNTHANGDHYFGNQLVAGARIISSRECAEDMKHNPPSKRAEQLRNWRQFGEGGRLLHEFLGGKFDFENIELTLPTDVFDETMALRVGGKQVHLHKVGPAHTRGDILVYVPGDRIVYTGDILFAQSHPVIWDGPILNWIKACDLMLGWDVEVVVPGHGPVSQRSDIATLKAYLQYLDAEVRKRFDAGMGEEEAAFDIAFQDYPGWGEAERIIINVDSLYREYRGDTSSERDIWMLYERMSRYRKQAKAGAR